MLVGTNHYGWRYREALQKLVDNYNSSQDEVFVDAQYQGSYDETLTKLRPSASGSGLGADLVQVFELGTTFMIDSGLIVPIQDYVDRDSYDLKQLEPNLLAYYTIDGKLNSMPFNSSTPIMYYNKDYFEEAGITQIPTTLEEIYQINDDLVAKTDATMALSLRIYGWYMEQFPQFQTAIDQLHDSTKEDMGCLSGVNQEARQIYENELERFLNGELSAKEAVDSMAEQVNASLKSYNDANQ